MIIIAGTRLISLTMKTFVLTNADMYYDYPSRPVTTPSATPPKKEVEEYQAKQTRAQRQRELAESLSILLVGLPVYLYHWNTIKKELKETA